MSFDISNYKLKHIVSMNPDLLDDFKLNFDIENNEYTFNVENVASEIIEFVDYFKYSEVKKFNGPIERKLKDFTYGKSFNEFSEHELYELRFSNFKVDGDAHEFEITGAGPTALKVSLYIKFKDIEALDYDLEKNLKEYLLNLYTPLIENNKNYQEKLKELKEKYDKEQAEREKIREEVRKEQAEKERKRKELEEFLNSNKPKNDRPFKMY